MKLFRLFIVLLLSLSVSSCTFIDKLKGENDSPNNNDEENENNENQSAPKDSVKMKAKIISIDDRITVEVLESEYTSGIHWVITSDATLYLDETENKISRSDLKENDTVEIFYSGQVMMSYPPQIVAARIRIVK